MEARSVSCTLGIRSRCVVRVKDKEFGKAFARVGDVWLEGGRELALVTYETVRGGEGLNMRFPSYCGNSQWSLNRRGRNE